MKIDLRIVSRFMAVVRTELAAGLPPCKAITAALRCTNDRRLARLTPKAQAILSAGGTVSDALLLASSLFPRFVVPVVKAGEQSGRTVETFVFLESCCKQLASTQRVATRAWLCPIAILAFGWTLRLCALLFFFRFRQAGLLALQGVTIGVVACAIYFVVRCCDRCRFWVDAVRLQLPLIRETDIDLSVCLYLCTFDLMYRTGGMAVDRMAEYARATVPNVVIREDMRRISSALGDRHSFASAFGKSAFIQKEYADEIASAAQVGRLEEAFQTVSRIAAEAMRHRLDLTNRFLWRVLALTATAAVAATLAMCLSGLSGA